MQSKLLKCGYEPGVSLIVGDRKDNAVEVDGIILHTAYCLSENVSLIEDGKIEDTTETVYICGHGNKVERKIGGRKMPEIADLLIKAGYKGKQQVYLIACSANEKYKGKTMVNLLEEELNKKLHRVVSDATGTTVTLMNNSGLTESWLLNFDIGEKQILQEYQDKFTKDRYIYRIKKPSELLANFKSCRDAITKYKEQLIRGELGK